MNASANLQMNLPAWPEVDFSEFGAIDTIPLSRIQKLTGGYLSRNAVVIPHVTHHDEVDITHLETVRKEQAEARGVKLTTLAFIAKAMERALRQFPQFNASLDASGQNLVLKKYFNIGIAVDTPKGLLVPVIRDCDKKSVFQIADEIAAVSVQAREKGLPMSQMVGGCMSISSLGSIGGTGFTPIVNAPEVAILGVTRSQWKPRRGSGGELEWRFMLPLSLSYDHRVINGADAARFVASIGESLAKPEDMLD
jgi:pyruvate dehydrogenase E2 component (dihydrolipoamide acetyltransferase)